MKYVTTFCLLPVLFVVSTTDAFALRAAPPGFQEVQELPAERILIEAPEVMPAPNEPPPQPSVLSEANAFRYTVSVPTADILVPTVVEMALSDQLYTGEQVLVYEHETDQFIASYLEQNTSFVVTPLQAQTVPPTSRSRSLVDENLSTTVEFPLTDEGSGRVQIVLESNQAVTTSQLIVRLSQFVSLPVTVAVEAEVNGVQKTIVAQKPMNSTTVLFPETTSQKFTVTFTYAQPLRITEMNLVPATPEKIVRQTLRFLAQPDYMYDVYLSPDQPVRVSTTEAGNLRIDEDVISLGFATLQPNPLYVPADVDGDSVRDVIDNCVQTYNPDQKDVNQNGRGDVCDDFDKDGVLNLRDNCVNDPNRNQADEDGDGIGDVCDDEESRFTERNTWVPWVGMGMAGLVIFVLFALVAFSSRKEEQDDGTPKSGSPLE